MMKAHPHLPPFPSREGREIDIDKERIKLSFSNAAKNYDSLATLQKEVAEGLIDFGFQISDFGLKTLYPASAPKGHPPHPSILDIGCGTGFLTHALAEVFSKTDIFGCDISHSMIKVASRKLQVARDKKIHLITTDGEILPCKNETFDIVISNLTYQWLPNLDTAFSEAHRVLRPGGIFIFSTLGTETLKELRYCYAEASAKFNKDGLPPFMGFSEKQAIQSVLESAGFKNISIEITKITKTYPDMWMLLKTMKSIGAGNPFKQGDKSLARGSLLKKMAEMYEEKFGVWSSEFVVTTNYQLRTMNCLSPNSELPTPNCIYATYEVMFVHAEK